MTLVQRLSGVGSRERGVARVQSGCRARGRVGGRVRCRDTRKVRLDFRCRVRLRRIRHKIGAGSSIGAVVHRRRGVFRASLRG